MITLTGFNTSYVSVEPLWIFYKCNYRKCFNTSYVSVELEWRLTNPNGSKVSIHHMYRLNAQDKYDRDLASKFQYIICIGWTEQRSFLLQHLWHVSIHHMYRLNSRLLKFLLIDIKVSIHHMYRLNNWASFSHSRRCPVSIHHMYRLNGSALAIYGE